MQVSLPPIEVVVLPQGKAETLPAQKAQNERVNDARPSVSKRRSLPPDPSEETAKSEADLSFLPSLQPGIENTETTPLEFEAAKADKKDVAVGQCCLR